jgi:hypothetical protein
MMFKLALIILSLAAMATYVQGNNHETTQNSTGHDVIDSRPAHEGCIGRLHLYPSSGVFEYDFLQYNTFN